MFPYTYRRQQFFAANDIINPLFSRYFPRGKKKKKKPLSLHFMTVMMSTIILLTRCIMKS